MNTLDNLLDGVTKQVDEIKEIEIALDQAKDRLLVEILKVGLVVDGDDERRNEVIQILYWNYPEIHVPVLAQMFGMNQHALRKIAGKKSIGLKCSLCSNIITKSSRSSDAGHLLVGDVVCDDCYERDIEQSRLAREAEWGAERCAEAKRQTELETMSYKKYLLTLEWDERRQQHLRSSKYRCQVCNTKDKPLHVHHRTYENRGNERWGDLITLCSECHELFYKHGKLQD